MAKRALGTTISINSVLIGGLTNINSPERTADTIDTTTLDAANGYRDFIQGFKDGGEVQISGFYDPVYTGQTQINDAYEAGTEDTYIITFPASIGAVLTFKGIITNLTMPGEANLDDPLGFECTIKVKGKPDLATTPSSGLTALSLTGTSGALSPTFATGKFKYAWTFTTLTSITVTASGVGHTMDIFVDGVPFQSGLASGTASNTIGTFAAGDSKEIDIVAKESGKAPKIYKVIAIRTT